MDHRSRNIHSEPRNTGASRPDAGLRWAGRLLFVTLILLITDLAMQPADASPMRLFGPDKIAHFGAFFVLTILGRMGWPGLWVWLTAALMAAYGLGIEIAQANAGVGRTASGADVVADLVGIMAGLAVAQLFRSRPAP